METLKYLIPRAIFLSYLVKIIVVGPSVNDVGVIFALSVVSGLAIYTEKKQSIQDTKEEFNKQLEEIKTVINKQSEVINLQAIEYAKLKNNIEGLKLKNDFRSIEGLTNKKVG